MSLGRGKMIAGISIILLVSVVAYEAGKRSPRVAARTSMFNASEGASRAIVEADQIVTAVLKQKPRTRTLLTRMALVLEAAVMTGLLMPFVITMMANRIRWNPASIPSTPLIEAGDITFVALATYGVWTVEALNSGPSILTLFTLLMQMASGMLYFILRVLPNFLEGRLPMSSIMFEVIFLIFALVGYTAYKMFQVYREVYVQR